MARRQIIEVAGLVGLFAILLVAAFFEYTYKPASVPLETPVETETLGTTTVGNISSSLVLIYSDTATSTLTQNRDWPTKNIWMKTGTTTPQLLGSVGKVGEYAYLFTLSPTHEYVAANLEKAVDIISLASKEKTRIFTTDKWIIGVSFSLDGSKLIIADGADFVSEQSKPLYSVDVKTGSKTVLIADVRTLGLGDIAPFVWRTDNKVLFYPVSYKDCGNDRLFVLDIARNTATSTYERHGISQDGRVALGAALETVPVPPEQEGMCSPSSLPTVVPVVDPLSGEVFGRVGKAGEPFTLVAFSPDHTQILFKTSKDLKNYAYYLQRVDKTSAPVALTDPWSVLLGWKAGAGPVEYAHMGQEPNSLYVGDTPVVTVSSNRWPELIGQFYK